jgi:hypothetical protein
MCAARPRLRDNELSGLYRQRWPFAVVVPLIPIGIITVVQMDELPPNANEIALLITTLITDHFFELRTRWDGAAVAPGSLCVKY